MRDTSGRGNNAYLTNGNPDVNWSNDSGRRAVWHDGVNDYWKAVNTSAMRNATCATWSIWAKFDTSGGHAVPAAMSTQDYLDDIFIGMNVTDFVVFVKGSSYTVAGARISNLRWHHLCVTFMGSKRVDVWLDGKLVGGGATAVSSLTETSSNTHLWFGSDGARPMKGFLDDPRAYSSVMSPPSIKLLALRRGISYELDQPTRYGSTGAAASMRRQLLLTGVGR